MPITGGGHSVAAQLLLDGSKIVPCTSFDLDLNNYSLSSSITARSPIYPLGTTLGMSTATATDWSKIHQQRCDAGQDLALGLQVLYASGKPPAIYDTVETFVVDQATADYGANEWTFVGRVAPNLQDRRVAGALPKHQRGDQLVAYLVSKYAPNLTLTAAPSPVVAGHDDDELAHVRSARGQSAWDLIALAAADDGYIFTVHNSVAYYGPAGGQSGVQTLQYAWGADLTSCIVEHAARRTRNIQVKVFAINRKGQQVLSAVYPPTASANGTPTEVYPYHLRTYENRAADLSFAQARYKEIASKEFVAELELIPDSTFISTIAAFGSAFLLQLGGVLPTHARTYHAKQVHLSLSGMDDQPQLLARITAENHLPSQQGA